MKNTSGKPMFNGLYVDDLLICSNLPSDVATMKKSFHDQFKMTDEGEVTHFLQIEVSRNRSTRTISLSQRQYVVNLLDKYAEHVPFAAGIPMKVGLKLPAEGPATGSSEHQAMASIPYRQVVGQLVYLSRTTWLDISQAVGVICRYLHNPELTSRKILTFLLLLVKILQRILY
jgi:hypothetical protein